MPTTRGCLTVMACYGTATVSSMEPSTSSPSSANTVRPHPISLPTSTHLISHNFSEKHILFVTNNATKSRRQYKAKFDSLGVTASVDEIFGSAYAAAVYISTVMRLPSHQKVYVIGEAGLEEELDSEGVSHIGGTDPADCSTDTSFSFSKYTHDDDVAAVVCGLDTRVTYTKYSKAFQFLTRNPGCAFVATNEDSTYPAGAGMLPGAGSISAPLRYATNRDPIAIGKPNKTMLDCIRAKHDFDPKRAIMVGDRLDTDILFGQEGGLATLLVLTGTCVSLAYDEKRLIRFGRCDQGRRSHGTRRESLARLCHRQHRRPPQSSLKLDAQTHSII